MADPYHLKKLAEGVNAWNQWRKKCPEVLPDLRYADMHDRILTGIDFHHTTLDGADLQNTKLDRASFASASLFQANLSGAKLRYAYLHKAFFKETILQRTNAHEAQLLDTMFLNVDLSGMLNLESVHHLGPSTIGFDTIQRSKGTIPDIFLLGTGASEQLLTCIHASGYAPFDYATCFISYSSHDQHFIDILYRDLRKAGVLCWYAPENMKAGEKFPLSITEAVQSREKVLVVLSKHSLQSDWVRREVALARQKEGNGKREVLIPIRLDSAVLNTATDWGISIRQKRHIRSFENWRQSGPYQKMFSDLLIE